MPIELDEEGQAALALGMRNVAEAEELCRKCKACGYDVTAQERVAAALRARLEAIRQQFGTGRRD